MTGATCVRALIAAGLLMGLIGPVQSHEIRPGYLQIKEIARGTFDVLWKVPARNGRKLGLAVVLPEACVSTEPTSRLVGGAYVERWRARCDGALEGGTVLIAGLVKTRTDVLARIERLDGAIQTVRLTPAKPDFDATAAAGSWAVIKTYFALGVEHILLGIDHLLFVLALLFLVGSWPRLIGTITAFTAAHSLTLAAATLGWVKVPQTPVEALIALSIMFVAVEVLHRTQGRLGIAARRPWLVAFAFGLLHGLGFAGALNEIGLPQNAIPLALAFFNIGVEVGQLLFIAAVFGLFWGVRFIGERTAATPLLTTWDVASSVARPSAYVIGTLAAFWLFQRTYGFWS